MLQYYRLKAYFLFVLLVFTGISSAAQDFIVSRKMDLGGEKIILQEGQNLVFTCSGRIYNGEVEGNGGSIITRRLNPYNLFYKVRLLGKWKGKANDLMFHRGHDCFDDYDIVSSIMKFEDVEFHRKKYYLGKWYPIEMNSNNIYVKGNGVSLIICRDKGPIVETFWGNRYKRTSLFTSMSCKNTTAYISGINIVDNNDLEEGWGEDLSVKRTVLYNYFCPGQYKVIMEGINTEGAGSLIQTYIVDDNRDEYVFRHCKVRTTNFAIELGNRNTSHTKKVTVEDCDFYRYSNAVFVGPVSLVGAQNQLDTVILRRNRFVEENIGNIELSGVKYVVFEENTTENLFCYSGEFVPQKYICRNNTVLLRKSMDPEVTSTLKIAGEEIVLEGNVFTIADKPFPAIVLYNPKVIKQMVVKGNHIIYEPRENTDSFSCLFGFNEMDGLFEMYDNSFESSFETPHFRNYIPQNAKRFEDAFGGKIIN